MARKPPQPYKSPVRYTEQELRAAYVADLEADIRFSLQYDSITPEWERYRQECQAKINSLRAGDPETLCIPRP